jgi:pimeloyl-ACP methyl ester carboxylesterase
VTAAPFVAFVAGPRVRTCDGVGIATYDLGGMGPPLLFAHATGFHGRVWLPIAAALAEHFHCWSFDSRGHGDSDPAPDGDYDWDGFGRDVRAVVAGLGFRRGGAGAGGGSGGAGGGSGGAGGGEFELLRAVGHSAGGAALLLAEEAQPATFSALYCYEPVVPITASGEGAPDGATPDDNPLAAGARRRREVFASRAAALDNYAGKPPFTTFDPAALLAYVEWGFRDLPDGTVELSCRREDEARVYEAAWNHHAAEHLDRVTCPVTLAVGGANAHFGVDVMSLVADRISGATDVEAHQDLGHFGPLERPAEIAASILAAFSRS